jgi:hypothetical protein
MNFNREGNLDHFLSILSIMGMWYDNILISTHNLKDQGLSIKYSLIRNLSNLLATRSTPFLLSLQVWDNLEGTKSIKWFSSIQ